MNETTKSPFDKEPAEGSRETVDKQLAQQEQRSSGSRASAHPDGQEEDKRRGK